MTVPPDDTTPPSPPAVPPSLEQFPSPWGPKGATPPPPPPPPWVPPGYGPPPAPPGYVPPGFGPPGYGPQGYAQPGYGYQTSTNGLAVASLILGILWLYWVGSILALVFGYIAKRQIAASQGRESGSGMATAGIVLGWIGAATLVLVIAAAFVAAVSNSN